MIPKQTVVQIRQTTDGLMESSNQYLLSFDSSHYHRVVIYLKGQLPEETAKRVAADEVIFLSLPGRNLKGLKLRALVKVYRLLKHYQPSVLFAHRQHPIMLSAIASYFVKIKTCFAVIHGTNQINQTGRRFFIKAFLKSRFYFIGISNVVRQDLLASRAGLLPSRVFSMPNAIEIEAHAKYMIPQNAAREKLGIPENCYVVGNIARLSKDKNQQMLLKSFAKALQQAPELFLVIIGSGSLESELKKLVQDLGIESSVLFAGHIDRAADYMKGFDLFVMTSNNEGFGRVLLEAMTARLPVIATDISAFAEVMDGAGTLVRPDDTEGLSRKILQHRAMDTDQVEEILADQDFILYDKYCLEKFKQRFKTLYKRLLVEKKPSVGS